MHCRNLDFYSCEVVEQTLHSQTLCWEFSSIQKWNIHTQRKKPQSVSCMSVSSRALWPHWTEWAPNHRYTNVWLKKQNDTLKLEIFWRQVRLILICHKAVQHGTFNVCKRRRMNQVDTSKMMKNSSPGSPCTTIFCPSSNWTGSKASATVRRSHLSSDSEEGEQSEV